MNARAKRWLKRIGVLFLLYSLVGFVLLPAVIKWQMRKQLPRFTHRAATVEQVRLNPYALSLTIRGLALRETNGAQFVSVGEFYANFELLSSLFQRGWVISEVRLRQPAVHVEWRKDGAFNFSDLLAGTETKAATPAQPKPLPLVRIEQFAITNGVVTFTDQRPATPANLKLDQLTVGLQGISTVSNAPIAATVGFRWCDSGAVNVRGKIGVLPVFADVEVGVNDFALYPIEPYVQEFARLSITSGAVAVQGHATYAPPGAPPPVIRFTGNVGVSRFGSIDNVLTQQLVGWNTLTLSGIVANVSPVSLHVAEIGLKDLNAGLVIGPDGAPNVTAMLVKSTNTIVSASSTTSPAASTQTTATPLPEITVDTIALDNATLRFRDESVQPNVSSTVEALSGTIKGLSSRELARADVNLTAKVDQIAPFSITGQINPLSGDLFTDLAIISRNVDLTPPSPYMGKYAGYPITKGRLNVDLKYHVSSRELKAENKIVIDGLTLGPRTDSPDATKLPVRLALALLTDRNGRIDLDVPIGGRLDDPKFHLGQVIGRVFLNILTKAATSPFSLLGALIPGGNTEELAYVDFAPGGADLTETQTAKLDKLAKALYERPALNLEIAGSIDPVADRDAIARTRLAETIKSRYVKETFGERKPSASLDQIAVPEKDHERLVKLIYKEKVGVTPGILGAQQKTQAVMEKRGASTNYRPARAAGGDQRPAPTTQPTAPSTAETPLASRPPEGPFTIAELETLLAERMEVTETDFRQLMKARADKVQSYLLQSGGLAAERLAIADHPLPASDSKAKSQALLTLN
jgi:hypothetical protein